MHDPFSAFLSLIVCVGLGLSVLLAAGFLRHRNAERGEFYALMLFGGAGMSLLAVSNELIVVFINIEVLSVSTYALAAYLRRGPRPAEAAFKYFMSCALAGPEISGSDTRWSLGLSNGELLESPGKEKYMETDAAMNSSLVMAFL